MVCDKDEGGRPMGGFAVEYEGHAMEDVAEQQLDWALDGGWAGQGWRVGSRWAGQANHAAPEGGRGARPAPAAAPVAAS